MESKETTCCGYRGGDGVMRVNYTGSKSSDFTNRYANIALEER